MEFNPQTSDDQSGGQVRSYTCAFCKRGFSNAQALGGHMNIHRRDRAKLKQSSEENLLSLEISIDNTTTNHDHSDKKPISTFADKDDHESQRDNKVIIGAASSGLPQIPLFVGRESSSNERIEEKKSDLDLELRLGLEPKEKAPTLSTREFF